MTLDLKSLSRDAAFHLNCGTLKPARFCPLHLYPSFLEEEKPDILSIRDSISTTFWLNPGSVSESRALFDIFLRNDRNFIEPGSS